MINIYRGNLCIGMVDLYVVININDYFYFDGVYFNDVGYVIFVFFWMEVIWKFED